MHFARCPRSSTAALYLISNVTCLCMHNVMLLGNTCRQAWSRTACHSCAETML